jgi:sugar phosphate isomerase/epimerase
MKRYSPSAAAHSKNIDSARRIFGRCSGILVLAAALSLRAENKIPDEYKTGGFFIGCQSYTFSHFTMFEAIDKTVEVGGKVLELGNGQILSKEDPDVTWNYKSPVAVQQKLKERLAQYHLRPVNYGVVEVPQNEAEARKLFEFAKFMGLRAIVTESVDSLDTIEKMVKEYDVMVGFHNHPKRADDPSYRMWDPNYVLSIVKDRDPRIGCCADTGHWVRSNLKPVECLRILKGRIVSCHLKDLDKMGPGAHDVPFGTGVSDIPGILEELKAQDFDGNLSIEYEYHWDNSSPEVAQCIGFVRGYGAAKNW